MGERGPPIRRTEKPAPLPRNAGGAPVFPFRTIPFCIKQVRFSSLYQFLCGVADAFARGVEGKLRFAARGAWPHGPAAWRENSASLRAMRWQHGPRCGRKTSLCCVWCVAARPCGAEGKFRVAAQCAGSMACGAEGKLRFAVCGALAAWPCGVEGKFRFAARGAWPHGLRRGGKALLCVVGERGKTGNILFQNVLFQKNNTKSSQFYGCAPVSQAAGCVLMAWNTAMSNFGSRL